MLSHFLVLLPSPHDSWNSCLPNSISALSDLLGSSRQSRSVNCTQCHRMVNPCDRISCCLRSHWNDIYDFKPLFPPRRMDHKAPSYTHHRGDRLRCCCPIRHLCLLRQYISSISPGTRATDKWLFTEFYLFRRESLSVSQSNGEDYKSIPPLDTRWLIVRFWDYSGGLGLSASHWFGRGHCFQRLILFSQRNMWLYKRTWCQERRLIQLWYYGLFVWYI